MSREDNPEVLAVIDKHWETITRVNPDYKHTREEAKQFMLDFGKKQPDQWLIDRINHLIHRMENPDKIWWCE